MGIVLNGAYLYMPLSPQPMLSCQVLDREAAQEPEFVARWKALSEQAWVANPFWDPDFCLPAMADLGGDDLFIAAVTEQNERMVALAPFKIARSAKFGPKIAELWTHDYIPLGTPLVTRESPTAFATLLNGIMAASNTPVFAKEVKQLSNFLSEFDRDMKVDVLDVQKRAALYSRETGPDYREQTLSRRRRQGLERRYRRLKGMTQHLGVLEIDFCRDPTLVPSRFEAFMRLEKLGWKGARETALLSNENHASFARAAVLGLSSRRHCMVATLKAGETMLAALTLFEMNGTVFSWKTTFDETYAEWSPGTQILARFADPIMEAEGIFKLDSCASPQNDIANTLWAEREEINTILVSRPDQYLAAAIARKGLISEQKLRSTAKKFLRR